MGTWIYRMGHMPRTKKDEVWILGKGNGMLLTKHAAFFREAFRVHSVSAMNICCTVYKERERESCCWDPRIAGIIWVQRMRVCSHQLQRGQICSDFLPSFQWSESLIQIQMKSMELFPLTLIGVGWQPKYLPYIFQESKLQCRPEHVKSLRK